MVAATAPDEGGRDLKLPGYIAGALAEGRTEENLADGLRVVKAPKCGRRRSSDDPDRLPRGRHQLESRLASLKRRPEHRSAFASIAGPCPRPRSGWAGP